MTAQPGRPQAPFTAGELAPTLHERRELKYYRAGARTMRNVEVIPQGGFRQAPGSRQLARARGDIVSISFAGATLAAPNGGTIANLTDMNSGTLLTTNALSGAGPHAVATVSFAAPVAVSCVFLHACSCSAGTAEIAVQYFDGTTWQTVGSVQNLKTSARHRNFGRPPGQPVSAAQWRIVAQNLSQTATVSIGEAEFYAEGASYGNVRLRAFMDADGNETLHVFAPFATDVLTAAGWQTVYRTFITDGLLPRIKTVQQLDTMIVFHPDLAPQRVLREGADTEWHVAPAPLVNIPNHDYGGSYTNGVAAQWEITMLGVPSNATASQNVYVVTVSGEDTNGISIPLNGAGDAPDFAAFATVLKDAIEALPNVEPGIAVAYDLQTGGQNVFTITFSGAGNEGDDWLVSMRCVDATSIACPAYRKVRGVAPGEPIISAARGWPRCGCFYQQRLLMGGLKSLPNAWMASWTGDYFNFDTQSEAATAAMLVPMDSQGGEAIEELVAGRSLMIMTSQAEYFLAERALSKTAAPNHVESSRHGSAAGVPAVENEGAAIFVDRSNGVLFEFRYDDVGQTFVTQNLSILASHLVDDVRDQTVRRATKDNDANNQHLVLANGEMRIFALLREQDVTAGMRRETDGAFKACATLPDANMVGVITERPVGGGVRRFVELLDPDALLDQSVSFTLSPASATVTGLGDFEGAQVWAIADDDVHGPFTVAGGQITLPTAATNVTVGRWRAPYVETLPLDRSIGPGTVLERRARIHTVRISLLDTTSLAIGANGGKIYDVPLFRFGDQMDVPSLQRRFTGVVKVQGLTGYADQPTVVITQKRPGYLNVRGITIEADL